MLTVLSQFNYFSRDIFGMMIFMLILANFDMNSLP